MRVERSRLVNGLEVVPPACFHGGEYQKVFFSCPIHRKPSISYRKIRLFRNFQIKGVFPTLNRSCVVLAPFPILSDMPLCLTSRLFTLGFSRKKIFRIMQKESYGSVQPFRCWKFQILPLACIDWLHKQHFSKKVVTF